MNLSALSLLCVALAPQPGVTASSGATLSRLSRVRTVT